MSILRETIDLIKGATALLGWLRERSASPDERALRRAARCADLADAAGPDCRRLSDAELRSELQAVSRRPESLASISQALTLAGVAMERRLGAWRAFDREQVPDSLLHCYELANEPATRASQVFDDLSLPAEEREVMRGIVRGREMLETIQPADVALPGSFYEALAALDAGSELRFTPTREQTISAALLLRGAIVEMDAGEGKTVSAGLAAIVAASSGRSVHVVTANDYLAQRDADWLTPVYSSLGISVDAVLSSMEDDERRLAYGRQVVYSTAREIGFDYLRDNLRLPPELPVQGPLDTVIVDEADHVLIDQDRTPLIISGEEAEDSGGFRSAHDAVEQLLALHAKQVRLAEANVLFDTDEARAGEDHAMLYAADPESAVLRDAVAKSGMSRHKLMAMLDEMHDEPGTGAYEQRFYYVTDATRSSVRFTQRGEEFLAHLLGQPQSDSPQLRDDPWTGPDLTDLAQRNVDGKSTDQSRWEAALGMVHQLLRAHTLFKRDIDYVVADGRVVIVDPMNGRLLPDNRYLHGLQAALEAKEGLDPRSETETIAQITVSGLISRYARVSGLTGTATEARDEFDRTYGLETVKVAPTHPKRRVDEAPEIFASNQDLQAAMIDQVNNWRTIGRPVLIGTVSVRQSEEISELLNRAGIEHSLLNAVTSEWEAKIVRDAGQFGAMTVSTNMAGRGTDIIIEPGLGDQIVTACLDRVTAILAERPKSTVALRCGTSEEAELIAEAAAQTGLRVSRAWDGSKTKTVRVSNTLCVAELVDDRDTIEFGLGLCVIGVALHQSGRVDRQLRGRAGRQGAFGASKVLASLQEDPIAFSRQAPTLNRLARIASAHDSGPNTRIGRSLRQLQEEAAADRRAAHEASRDYTAVLEHQTLTYYRARQLILTDAAWSDSCEDMARTWAEQFVSERFGEVYKVGYLTVFEKLVARLWSDLGIDCDGLFGAGEVAISDALTELLTGRLAEIRVQLGDDAYDDHSRTLLVRAADQLWPGHLSHLRDVALSTAIAGPTHREAAAHFAGFARDAYRELVSAAWRRALPEILTLHFEGHGQPPSEKPTPVSEEILSLLA